MNGKCIERTAEADISSWKYLEEIMNTVLQSSPKEKKRKQTNINNNNKQTRKNH